MIIKLASPRGFCAGVDRAISIVERALEIFGAPIYVRHEIVHNRYIVETLKVKGALFVEEIDEIPNDSTVIFSAHGVSQAIHDEAAQRGLQVFDATCPLVTKVHMEVVRFAKQGYDVILIGHAGHPEVEGTMGHFPPNANGDIYLVENIDAINTLNVTNPNKLAFVTQTTLSVDETTSIIAALRQRFPKITMPKKEDICYATQNRQDAVKSLAEEVDVLLVIGSTNSSNSNRLREIAAIQGNIPAYLIDGADNLELSWLEGKDAVGVTAGASAPEVLVNDVIKKLKSHGAHLETNHQVIDEKMYFSLPKTLERS